MLFFQLVVLALVQGLTEFLPVSSSAHLILVPVVFGWQDQGLAFDVAVHVGSLLAVTVYFRKSIAALIRDGLESVVKRRKVGESTLAWAVLIGTIPAGLAGIMLDDMIELYLRHPLVIASSTVVFGLLLWVADHWAKCVFNEAKIGLKEGLFIGVAQALALIPGTSRSGITITAGLLLGFDRSASARFSFLLSIPLILAAGLLKTKELAESAVAVDWNSIVIGTCLSFVSAYACIYLFLKWIEKSSMLPFVIYRLVLGVVLFAIFI